MVKLEKLSEEQKKLMSVVVKEWVDRCDGKYAADEEVIRQEVMLLYDWAKIGRPSKIIFIKGLNSSVWDSVGASVWDSVRDSVWDSVGASVWDSVRDSVKDSVKDSVGIYDYDWISFYDYFERIGVLNDEKFAHLKKLLAAGAWMIFPFTNAAIVLLPPFFLNRDERGRLHSTSDKAIAWEDGSGLYFVHGVKFDEDTFRLGILEKSLSAKDVLALANVEQKAVLIQHYGYDEIMKAVSAKVLDSLIQKSNVTGKDCVCEVIEFDAGNGVVARLLRVQDHSVGKVTTLGVPREKATETVTGALAWTFGVETEDYEPKVET